MTGGTTPAAPDDEHKRATKEVVDDMFRDDVLGPRICSVLENHTPASSKVTTIIADAINKEPAIKNAIEAVLTDLDAKRKIRLIDKFTGALWALGIGAIGSLIAYTITHGK